MIADVLRTRGRSRQQQQKLGDGGNGIVQQKLVHLLAFQNFLVLGCSAFPIASAFNING
jgi:hypothetical protein